MPVIHSVSTSSLNLSSPVLLPHGAPAALNFRRLSTAAAQKAARSHVGAGSDLGEKGLSVLGDAAAEGTVETFALVRPAKSNAFQGVYIYIDEACAPSPSCLSSAFPL